jgi:hypothetical protein
MFQLKNRTKAARMFHPCLIVDGNVPGRKSQGVFFWADFFGGRFFSGAIFLRELEKGGSHPLGT